MEDIIIKSDFYEGTLRVDVKNNKSYFTPEGGKEVEIPVDSKKNTDIIASYVANKTDKAVAR